MSRPMSLQIFVYAPYSPHALLQRAGRVEFLVNLWCPLTNFLPIHNKICYYYLIIYDKP